MSDHLLFDRVEYTPDDVYDPFEAKNQEIAMAMYGCLQTYYPGHPWATMCDVKQGVAAVRMPAFTNADYVLHLADFDPALKVVRDAGGEFLERYKIPRAKFSLDDYNRILAANPLGYMRHSNVPE